MAKSLTFDYQSHNQKIAKIRGENWKKNLRQSKRGESALARVRYDRGLSQMEILPHVGINTQTTYARIERGDILANREKVEKITKFLRVKPEDIFLEVESNKFLAI